MAEFIGGNKKDISVGEPIVFENETECEFEVCAGIVFRKSGIYEVSVAGNRTIVSEVPEQKWIPVSERLPEVGTYVLVSKKSLGFRSNLPNVCTAHRSRDPRSGKEEWNDMLFGKLDDDDVLAWMPLPEPYREENE